jgi:hypothetical protein
VTDAIQRIGGNFGPPYCEHLPCQRTAHPEWNGCSECIARTGLGAKVDECTACFRHQSADDTSPSRGRRIYHKPPPS